MDVQPSKPTSKGPANWFTGEVWIDPIAPGHEPNQLSLGNVHFTPCARTAWHSHTIAQTLYVSDAKDWSRPAARLSSRSAPATSSPSPAASGTATAPPPTAP